MVATTKRLINWSWGWLEIRYGYQGTERLLEVDAKDNLHYREDYRKLEDRIEIHNRTT